MAQKINVISLQSCIFPSSKRNIKADFLNLSALNMYVNITINYEIRHHEIETFMLL